MLKYSVVIFSVIKFSEATTQESHYFLSSCYPSWSYSCKYPILPPLLNRYTQDKNVHLWVRGPAKPPCRLFNIYADMYKYQVISINERTEAPKPDTKTPKNQQVEKTRGTCTPDQGSGATLGVLGYASA